MFAIILFPVRRAYSSEITFIISMRLLRVASYLQFLSAEGTRGSDRLADCLDPGTKIGSNSLGLDGLHMSGMKVDMRSVCASRGTQSDAQSC